ncbi:Uncharacterised protein [Mycobacterium tuberculosis]|nr:Uncharacterised protein [Mycobacterium tuberculosis]
MPNEEIPASRGRAASRGHGRASVSSSTAPPVQSTAEEGSSTCRVAGIVSCRMASRVLITPATPAAAWACPMFDFTEPRWTGPFARSAP